MMQTFTPSEFERVVGVPPTEEQQKQLEDCRHVVDNLGAAIILLGSPCWPRRERLSAEGQSLYDAILRDAKAYCYLCDAAASECLPILAEWSKLCNVWLDSTQINSPDPRVTKANHRMLAVFKYYCDAYADFGVIQK